MVIAFVGWVTALVAFDGPEFFPTWTFVGWLLTTAWFLGLRHVLHTIRDRRLVLR